MAFDLDDEELRATRRDKGLDDVLYEETNDKNVGSIEDIRDLLLFLKSHGWIPDINRTVNITNVLLAIDNVLQEREQDKKRIKEPEEENRENKKKYLALLISQFPDTTETYKKYKKELEELLEGEK
jgi:hypothetical protein